MPLGRTLAGDEAITPVVGTSLLLVITVLGMAGVLFWGTPTLQGIQDRGSVVGMEGEFDELRRAGLELSVPDASRVPSVTMEDGVLSLEDGTRMMVSVAFDAANLDCDFDVEGWDASGSTLTVHAPDCRSGTIEVFEVTGSSTIEQTNVNVATSGTDHTITWDTTGTEQDYSEDNWVIRLTNGGTTTYAEAWVLEQKRITWRLGTSVSNVQLHLEGGAIFEVDSGSYFLHRDPAIREAAFGSEDYVLRLITLLGSDSGSAGRGSPEVFMGLVGNHIRTSTSIATQIRYAFHGDIAEAWCQTLTLRNSDVGTTTAPFRQYTVDEACDSALPSVVYDVEDAGGTRVTFPFEFIHARITTSISA